MGADLFMPGDEVLVVGTIKHVSGNFLVVKFADSQTQQETEVVVLKKSSVPFKTPMSTSRYGFQRFNDRAETILELEKFATVGLVRQLDEVGELTDYRWLQDLGDESLRPIAEVEVVK